MSTDNRQLLRKQLEYQAKLFTESQNKTELIVSALTSCSAMLRAIDGSMPKTISKSEFDTIFAGYLGIIGRVDDFYNKNSSFFDADESEMLNTIITSLEDANEKKEDLDKKLADAEERSRDVNNDVLTAERLLEKEEEKIKALREKEKGSKKQLKKLEEEEEKLEDNLKKITQNCENFETNIERLIQEVKTAEETYEEMLAYYPEIQRIQEGVKEEGYVDMESFHNKIKSMNDSGKKLMEEYDSLLKNLTSDIETLQAKIENRRKAGTIG